MSKLYKQPVYIADSDMESVDDNIKLSDAEKQRRLEEVKGRMYEGWAPYCLMCDTFERMERKPYGFQCDGCKNMIGWNLQRLKESPINKIAKIQCPETT